jgi:DNA-binding response OmpR family regulator
MATILLVDDEPKIVQLGRDYLERAGFSVASASNGEAALAAFRSRAPELIVLDLGLPGADGLDVTRQIRRESDVPIIMLTARGEESDKLVGLELGADDYMVKPFSPKELVARVRAVLRRAEGRAGPAAEVLRVMDLTLDLPRQRLTVGERPIEPTWTDLHPRPAARRRARRGVRIVRAGDRHAHQEPAPED